VSAYDHVEILLAEDSAYDAELMMDALESHNLRNKLLWVKDGAEVIDFVNATGDYAEREPGELPKLILLDLKMPKLDGLDVLRILKGEERTRGIPIVAMTSSSQERDLAESYRLGTNAYVIKPVDSEKFSEAVSKLGLFWLLLNNVPL
jgi:two-component system response regulator